MYFVPDTQKNAYLKEVSSLAKAIHAQPTLQDLKSLADLSEVRHRLLDAINIALESTAPDARARMIQLEVKHAAVQQVGFGVPGEIARALIPLSILAIPGSKPIVLCQDRDVVAALEVKEQLAARLAEKGSAEQNGIQVFLRSSSSYQPDRVLYDCLALRANGIQVTVLFDSGPDSKAPPIFFRFATRFIWARGSRFVLTPNVSCGDRHIHRRWHVGTSPRCVLRQVSITPGTSVALSLHRGNAAATFQAH